MIDLADVYEEGNTLHACRQLYLLLLERKPEQSISHKKMPTFDQHCAFVDSKPYACWYFIKADGHIVGSVYLTKRREIGISIFKIHQRRGFGMAAVKLLMEKHPGPILANVNPRNTPSKRLWESLGGKLLQVTYELRRAHGIDN